jgi:hypothetical protein
MIIECPNHKGSFDCNPFCRLCQGEQEYEDSQFTTEIVLDIEMRLVVDDVGGGTYRASIYDKELTLLAEDWSEIKLKAITNAIQELLEQEEE